MDTETFIIKSLYVQNTIMLSALGVVVSLLIHAIMKKRPRRIAVFTIWLFLVLWFFNSPLFGFSVVTVNPEGIKLDYGILSFRNRVLPPDSEWKVQAHSSGIRKTRRLYSLAIGGCRSMKVKGAKKRRLLQDIGKSIERVRSQIDRAKNPSH